jgi:hypothetical protein
LKCFDISDAKNTKLINTINVGAGAETLFPYNGYLFIGTQTGMLIYNLSNPEKPTYQSRYNHIVSCDPVVVQGNYAYVTLHTNASSNRCNRGVNNLEVIDISNIDFPQLKKTVTMTQPLGLGVDGNSLFVCDKGLKVFDITKPLELTQTKYFTGFSGFDVIPYNKNLILVANEGIYQYDYTNTADIKLISQIAVGM